MRQKRMRSQALGALALGHLPYQEMVGTKRWSAELFCVGRFVSVNEDEVAISPTSGPSFI